ncbi:ATP-dependent helicase [Chitinivibrio alkaliphilus]|uniref:DNA 3'-5' helicase n=1 Tax=Chitinivibrio alkaliphilus ACht1 TaxID=1313304 RepID=U7D9B3_9BACT|nr:UvrD-helicase domain-containing protein [Chitinivibrio alkaliphilus]ERP31682.1 ATP-dependent DNA helicase PcrA [Chitinivibrio alkaliphilus ACht1]
MDLSGLDTHQKKAVLHTEGPLLVLAGAGSGKTRVLTYRICRIVEKKLAKPEEILALTFTNKAAKEMRTRIGRIVGSTAAHRMTIATFHSLGVRILREYGQYIGLKGDFKILSDHERIAQLKKAMRHSGKTIARGKPQDYGVAISLAKNDHLHAHTFDALTPEERKTAKVYTNYTKLLQKQQTVDFDDLLLLPLRLFHEHPHVRDAFRQRYRYISIDEFQDTNTVQMKLARIMAEPHGNIMAVGDDDQGIYSWRGAKITNILRFPYLFAGCNTIYLTTNYRSSEEIVQGAQGVVQKNRERKAKTIISHRGSHDPIVTYRGDDEDDEVQWVVDQVYEFHRTGQYCYDQQALLFRTNAHMRRFEEELRLRRIPYHIHGGTSFFDRKEVKDILAYLHFFNNQEDELSLQRVLKVPDRGISAASLKAAEELCIERSCSLWETFLRPRDIHGLQGMQCEKIGEFASFAQPYITAFQKGENLAGLLDKLLNHIQYRETVRKIYGKEKSLEPRLANIDELCHAMDQYVYTAKKKGSSPTLGEFLQHFTIIKGQETDQGSGLTLLTLHKSKGLEFPVVFMVLLDDAVIPSPKALEGGGLEEERRLFYVGMTRAMEKLFLTYPKSKVFRNKSLEVRESRFIHEIPLEYLDAPPGEKEEEEFQEFSQNFFKEMQEKFSTP